MVLGEGGYLGSDLSAYAQPKSAQQIRNAILNPSADPDPHERVAIAVTREGRKISGLARNEDNFSVQLQTSDGAFHFLKKSELDKLEFGPETVMPSDYGKKLSGRELDDVISYLMNSARIGKRARAIREEE
jgi:cytochrome c oxidase cbb3-type subunit 3